MRDGDMVTVSAFRWSLGAVSYKDSSIATETLCSATRQ